MPIPRFFLAQRALDAAAQGRAVENVANVHRHDGERGDPQRASRRQHRGDHELAGARVNNAGEEQTFQRSEAELSGVEAEGEGHGDIADDDRQAVFQAFSQRGRVSGGECVNASGFSIGIAY